jgi:hypothetical protein
MISARGSSRPRKGGKKKLALTHAKNSCHEGERKEEDCAQTEGERNGSVSSLPTRQEKKTHVNMEICAFESKLIWL